MQLCFERVCGWTRPCKYENVILKNNEIVKGFSKMNSIMFLCILIINKNRLIYTTLSICLWVDFYVLQISISFHVKYFLFRKTNGLWPFFWRCINILFVLFFIQTQIYIHAHTKYDNQSIKNMEVWIICVRTFGLFYTHFAFKH